MDNHPTTNRLRFRYLDGMRGWSVLMVVISHVCVVAEPNTLPFQSFLGLVFHGVLGVRVFFVVSGFIITHLLLAEYREHGRIHFGKFYVRRGVRLLPALYAYLALSWLGATLKGWPTVCASEGVVFLAAFRGECSWLFAHLWSLSLEEVFYLTWPLLLLLGLRRRVWPSLALYFVGANLIRVCAYFGFRLAVGKWNLDGLSYLDQMAMGSALAWAISYHGDILKRVYELPVAPLRLFFFALIYVPHALAQHGQWGWLTLSASTLLMAFGMAGLIGSFHFCPTGWTYRILCSRLLVQMGLASYSIYLWQQFFLQPGSGWPLPMALLGVAVSGGLSYLAIERTTARFAARRGWGRVAAARVPEKLKAAI